MEHIKYETFIKLLQSSNWKLFSNANSSYKMFIKKFLELYNVSFSLQRIYIKNKRKNKPWMTNDILKLSKKKCRMYKLYMKNKTDYRKEVYI